MKPQNQNLDNKLGILTRGAAGAGGAGDGWAEGAAGGCNKKISDIINRRIIVLFLTMHCSHLLSGKISYYFHSFIIFVLLIEKGTKNSSLTEFFKEIMSNRIILPEFSVGKYIKLLLRSRAH